MNRLKIFGFVLAVGIVMTFGSWIGEWLAFTGIQPLVPAAEARVGRPLTPVSVAGVGRRTVRRCAAGVYNCRFSVPQSADILLGQTSAELNSYEGCLVARSFRLQPQHPPKKVDQLTVT